MNRTWTAISTITGTGERCKNEFHGKYDYNIAGREFQEKFPGHVLEVLMPGNVELRFFSLEPRVHESKVHPLNDLPSGF